MPALAKRATNFWFLVGAASFVSLVVGILSIVQGMPVIGPWGDAHYYHYGANLLVEGHGWILPYDFRELGVVTPAADHPPIFILYLAMFSLVGLDSVGAHQVATALLAVAAVPVVAIVGRRLGGKTVGVIAAFLCAVHPGVWSWDKMMLSETLAILAVSSLLAVSLWVRDAVTTGVAQRRHYVILGLAIGLCALSRAELLLLGAVMAVFVVARANFVTTIKALVIPGLVALLVIAPWVTFNLSRFNEPVFLSDGAGITLANSNCDESYSGELVAYWNLKCVQQPTRKFKKANPDADRSELVKFLGNEGRSYISDHLGELPRIMVQRIGRAFGFYRPGQQMTLDHFPEGRDRSVVRWAWYSYYILLPFAFGGAWLLRKSKAKLTIMLLPIASAMFAVAITFGSTRYRASAEPTFIVLGSIGIAALLAWAPARRNSSADSSILDSGRKHAQQ